MTETRIKDQGSVGFELENPQRTKTPRVNTARSKTSREYTSVVDFEMQWSRSRTTVRGMGSLYLATVGNSSDGRVSPERASSATSAAILVHVCVAVSRCGRRKNFRIMSDRHQRTSIGSEVDDSLVQASLAALATTTAWK